jgi:ribosome-associated translation inhibitor RaiA
MSIPLDLTFRDMEPSDAVTAAIQHALDHLSAVFSRIQRCSVVVERPHQSKRHGQGFHIRLEIVVPDRVINVARDPGHGDDHVNVYVAINDAFHAARRQLHDHAEIIRGDVKAHA